jgi:hypothetical protein
VIEHVVVISGALDLFTGEWHSLQAGEGGALPAMRRMRIVTAASGGPFPFAYPLSKEKTAGEPAARQDD